MLNHTKMKTGYKLFQRILSMLDYFSWVSKILNDCFLEYIKSRSPIIPLPFFTDCKDLPCLYFSKWQVPCRTQSLRFSTTKWLRVTKSFPLFFLEPLIQSPGPLSRILCSSLFKPPFGILCSPSVGTTTFKLL